MMSLSLKPMLVIECDCCMGHMEDHETGCPRAQLQTFVTSLKGPTCPVCHQGSIYQNRDDFLECARCHALFTRSMVAMGYDPDKLERKMVLDYDANEYYTVLLIPRKGKGQFRHKEILKNFETSIRKRRILVKKLRKERAK